MKEHRPFKSYLNLTTFEQPELIFMGFGKKEV